MQDILEFIRSTLNFEYQVGGITPLKPGHSTGWRTMPVTLCACVVGGRALVELRGAESVWVEDGEAFVVNRDMEHRISVYPSGRYFSCWCHFRLTVFHGVDVLSFYDLPPVFPGAELERLCRAMAAPTGDRMLESVIDQKRLGLELAGELLKRSKPREGAAGSLRSISRIAPALELMRENLHRPFSLSESAAALNYSKSRFLAVFQEIMGTSPGRHFNSLRMDKAKGMLLSTDATLSEIAESLGYFDAFHFSKQFKKACGVSPKEYRVQSHPGW